MADNSGMLWLVLGGACVVGYFVVSKVVDFFMKDSAWEEPPAHGPDEHPDDGLIGGHDPTKPIG